LPAKGRALLPFGRRRARRRHLHGRRPYWHLQGRRPSIGKRQLLPTSGLPTGAVPANTAPAGGCPPWAAPAASKSRVAARQATLEGHLGRNRQPPSMDLGLAGHPCRWPGRG
ncbi:hypothetical protein BHM03_00013680, partial [Ensete ventricosum]